MPLQVGVDGEDFYLETARRSTMFLSTLSPEVNVSGRNVTLKCRAGQCIIGDIRRKDNGDITSSDEFAVAELVVNACDLNMAKRVAEAFSYLIRLNGGKKSVF